MILIFSKTLTLENFKKMDMYFKKIHKNWFFFFFFFLPKWPLKIVKAFEARIGRTPRPI